MSSSSTRVVFRDRWKGEPCCAFCGVPKVLAESKLHEGWLGRSSWGSNRTMLSNIRSGAASSCDFCALILDACTAQNFVYGVDAVLNFHLDKHSWEGKCRLGLSYFDNEDFHNEGNEIFLTEGQYYFHYDFIEFMRAIESNSSTGNESGWNLNTMRHPSGDTSSTQAATTIKCWIKTCQHGHEACREQPRTFQMPQRVLRLTEEDVQLCENVASMYPYACLSHCWGDAGPSLKLTSANIQSIEAGILVQHLPKTFRDAVEVCLNIGIHFLWIDALCIIQGDEEDWHTAAASMANIYAGATVTLAATWSDSSDQGCFSRMQEIYASVPLQEPGLYVRRVAPAFPHDQREYVAGDSPGFWPLLTRAWVFQERILSTRIVHFGKEQLYWECNSVLLSEDGSEDVRYHISPVLKSVITDPVEAWKSAVTHYSVLKLTYESDRLPAISAVVKRLQPVREGDIYIAGMWLDSLLEDLCWVVEDGNARRPDESRPTWSWVSVSGGVTWTPATVLESAALVRTDFEVKGPSHFGYASNASITLQGPSCQAKIQGITSWCSLTFNLLPLELSESYHDVQHVAAGYQDFDWASEESFVQSEEVLTLLLLCEHRSAGDVTGLVLRDIGHGQHHRVGQVRLDSFSDWDLVSTDVLDRYVASLPIKEFTIV